MTRNPQAEQMADASMIRNLAAQAEAIWPEESRLFERYELPAQARIADVGCGSGEISARLARLYPVADVVGIDVLEGPLAYARDRHAAFGERLRFQQGDAFSLDFPDESFDLVVCRHVTQAVPEPERLLAELLRVCRAGGWLHVLSEDYGMLHFPDARIDRLWDEGLRAFSRATNVDERVGRKTWSMLQRLGVTELALDYVVVDTLRAPRPTFAEVFAAWRDGYSQTLDEHAGWAAGTAAELFDAAIGSVLDPEAYAAWHIPVLGGRKAAWRG